MRKMRVPALAGTLLLTPINRGVPPVFIVWRMSIDVDCAARICLRAYLLFRGIKVVFTISV